MLVNLPTWVAPIARQSVWLAEPWEALVTGENECVEANFPKGVVVSNLEEEYFKQKGHDVVFRKPKDLTADLAERIVNSVTQQVGTTKT